VSPVRNFSKPSNSAGIILGPNPTVGRAAEQQGIMSNGVKGIPYFPSSFCRNIHTEKIFLKEPSPEKIF
jgi:hypothetical protein